MNIDTETQSLSLEDVILELYSDIKQEITSKPQDMEELKKINIFQIVDYLRQSIDLLTSLRMEKLEKEVKLKQDSSTTTYQKNENYENLIRKLEKEIRQHIRIENEMKLHFEFMEFTKEENEKLKKLNSKFEQKLRDLSVTVKKQEEEILNLKKCLIKKEEYYNEVESKLKHQEEISKTARNTSSASDSNCNILNNKLNTRSLSIVEPNKIHTARYPENEDSKILNLNLTSLPKNQKTFHHGHNRSTSININSIKKIEFNIFSNFKKVSFSPNEKINSNSNSNSKKINKMISNDQKLSSRGNFSTNSPGAFPTLPSQKDLSSINKKMLLHLEGLKNKCTQNNQNLKTLNNEYSSTEVSNTQNINLKLRKMVLNKLKISKF